MRPDLAKEEIDSSKIGRERKKRERTNNPFKFAFEKNVSEFNSEYDFSAC